MAKYCVFITISMPKLKKKSARESFLTRPSLGASIGVVAELMVALGAGNLQHLTVAMGQIGSKAAFKHY